MRTFCHKLQAVILIISIVIGLVEAVPVCKVKAATIVLSSETVANYFNSQVGKSVTQASCLSFIADGFQALGAPRSSANCAYEYGSSHIISTSMDSIPVGADVFFLWNSNYKGTWYTCGNHYCHHIGVYVGDGYVVHTSGGKVIKTKLTDILSWGVDFRGWGYHGNVILDGNGNISVIENSYIFSSIRAENITETSAKIIADYAKDTYGDVGFYFGTSPDLAAMTKVSEFKYSSIVTTTSFNNSYQVGVYYDDTYKYKWWPALTPGTTYYYAFYCTKNGVEHISSIQSFATVGGGESAFPLIDGEIYKIYSALSGHVMEVSDGDSANGKRITLWPYGGASWMQWKAVQHADGYSFVNVATGKALDISGGSAEAKAVLQQWDYKAVDAQRFRLVDQGNGRYGMFARCSGLAVDVYASVTSPGATMAQYAFHGGDNQLWYFELIDKTAPVISNVRVTDVDSTGYTVLCDVTDNAGVARVAFSTWTDANGGDDLAQDWFDSCAVFQPSYGNTYAFRVNSAAHNNEYGLYTTHIYAYDAAGNSVSDECNITLPSPVVSTPAPTAAPTPVPTLAPTPSPSAPSVSYTLSGSVKCFGKSTLTTTIQLINSSGAATASTTVTGNAAEYKLENVPAGTYILRVCKPDHVTREYSITVTNANVIQNVEILLLGDVNGDGKISFRDKKVLYNHIEKISVLSGYLFNVGDVDNDGKISFRDKKMLYNHIEHIALMWKEN